MLFIKITFSHKSEKLQEIYNGFIKTRLRKLPLFLQMNFLNYSWNQFHFVRKKEEEINIF